MTIQKTVLFGLTLLLYGSSANAQYCARAHTVYAYPSYHQLYRLSYPTSRSSYSSPHHPQTVELPPRPADISFGGFSHVDELAARLERETSNDDELVQRIFKLCFGREPDADERDRSLAFFGKDAKARNTEDDLTMLSFCQAMLCTAEFRNLD